jgi:cellulose synthase/poly-beta-1,6-N-acetylglucosamine synthase-like glycosyltransferase
MGIYDDTFALYLYRLLGVAYLAFFGIYFYYRFNYSIGELYLGWRYFVFAIELASSISVCFVVILKIRRPFTKFVSQGEGREILDKDRRREEAEVEESEFEYSVSEGFWELDEFDETSPLSPGDEGTKKKKTKKADTSDDEEGEAGTVAEKATKKRVTTAGDKYTTLDVASGTNTTRNVLRCLVPCYKESLGIVKETVLAALHMDHPKELLHVYICDDGNDADKQSWVNNMSRRYPNLHYVTRPPEFKGHGKAGNLNYTLKHIIYGKYKKTRIPSNELVAIFDADMVCLKQFSLKIMEYFEDGRVALVQTPQTFHNVPMNADFFDAHNMNFFQYMLPGMDSWNTTTCCGTNFVVRARALKKVKWFPTISVTEDMHLAIQLLSIGALVKYHGENLVVGEAPQDLRQIFQQRSRWAKGTIQIMWKANPLLNQGLTLMQRLSFFNACYSYLTSAFTNPLFVMINALAVLVGLFPVKDVDFTTAMLFVTYYTLFYVMIHFTPRPSKHYISLWIVGKMGHFFSFMALKAIYNVTRRTFCGNNTEITFKATEKKAKANEDGKDYEEVDDGKYSLDDIEGGEYDDDDDDDLSEISYADSDEYEHHEFQKGPQEERDSSHRDIRFHVVMCAFIIFTVSYGAYVILGGESVFPDFPDERSVIQKKGIRAFCMLWMMQFFIAYGLPIWYAYLPQNFSVQAKALKAMATIDSFISIALIVVTVILFKVPVLRGIPQIQSFRDLPPSPNPFWIDSPADLGNLFNYMENAAIERTIPVVIMNMRHERTYGLYQKDGVDTFGDYLTAVDDAARILKSTRFPSVVILEPEWIYEVYDIIEIMDDELLGSEQAGYTYEAVERTFENGTVESEASVGYDIARFTQLIDAWVSLSYKTTDETLLYLSVGESYFLKQTAYEPIRHLASQLADKRFRGIALNTASYFDTESNAEIGYEVFAKYNWHFLIDTSRNGGEFSNTTLNEPEDIAQCRFDPPGMDVGALPEFIQTNTTEDWLGNDGNFYGRVAGQSDGRLYPAGDYHDCLKYHAIPCGNTCPMPESNSFSYRLTCQCD